MQRTVKRRGYGCVSAARGVSPRRVSLLLAAAIGGISATALGIPAGALLGAMAAAFAANLVGPSPPLPRVYGGTGKALIGTAIGAGVGPTTWALLGDSILQVMLGIALLLVLGMANAAMLVKLWQWSPATALLACVPGGLSEFASSAADFGAATSTVVAVHTVRMLTVLVLAPLALSVLLVGKP